MKVQKSRYRNTSFLVELLVNILVFSISCAVLVGLFGRAGQMTKEGREEAAANAEMLALVEIVKARGTAGLEHADDMGGGSYRCRYDEDWQPTGKADAPFAITLVVTEADTGAGTLTEIEAVAETGDGRQLAAVQTAAYRPAEGGAAA